MGFAKYVLGLSKVDWFLIGIMTIFASLSIIPLENNQSVALFTGMNPYPIMLFLFIFVFLYFQVYQVIKQKREKKNVR